MLEGIMTRGRHPLRTVSRRSRIRRNQVEMALQRHVGASAERAVVVLAGNLCGGCQSGLRHHRMLSVVGEGGRGALELQHLRSAPLSQPSIVAAIASAVAWLPFARVRQVAVLVCSCILSRLCAWYSSVKDNEMKKSTLRSSYRNLA
jgi:hypothetical protein